MSELRRLLGFSRTTALDGFVKARHVYAAFEPDDLDRDRHDLDGLGL